MTRTADLMANREWRFPLGIDEQADFMADIAEQVPKAPVIVADNVGAYVQNLHAPVDPTSYPSLAPPWPQFWIEYASSGSQRRGVWVFDTTDMVAPPLETDDDMWTCAHQSLEARVDAGAGEVRWVLTLLLFVEQERGVWGPVGMSSLALDPSGVVIGSSWSIAPIVAVFEEVKAIQADHSTNALPPIDFARATIPKVTDLATMEPDQLDYVVDRMRRQQQEDRNKLAELIKRRDLLVDRCNTLRTALTVAEAVNDLDAYDDDENQWLKRALAPAMQSIAFLHCKNVVTDEIIPPPKVQAKRRKRGKEPLVRYHTLRLEVPRRQSASSSGVHDIGSPALHIVAGHFAHYGACCANHSEHGRLFGRLEGVYWVPSHVRGDRQSGRVQTDFDLVLP